MLKNFILFNKKHNINTDDILEKTDFIIKTFKRYDCLNKLLKSIRKFYPKASIIIADDNSENEFDTEFYRKWKKILDIKLIKLPFDSGVSAGRNKMVESSKKPYILLLDDDLVFTSKTKIEKFYKILTSDRTTISNLSRHHRFCCLSDG